MTTVQQTGSIDLEASNTAAKTATNYIRIDPESGIRIASSNPDTATTYQRQTATETEFVVNDALRNRIDSSGMELFIGKTGSEVSMMKLFANEENQIATAQIRIGEKNSVKTVIGGGEFKIIDPSDALVTRVVTYNTHDRGLA